VELKFTVNRSIRACDDDTFCLAGPGAKPHVIVQQILAPGETADVWLPEPRAGLRLRSPQVAEALSGTALELAGQIVCRHERFVVENSVDSHRSIPIHNPNSWPIVLRVEKTAWTGDVLTAARVTNLQEFRDLFAQQVISPSEHIVVGQQVILFTDLRGSTAMYLGIGDAPAYALVRDHFDLLRGAIRDHRGGIVKTIGDAVMAVFSNPGDALRAVQQMHAQMQRVLAPRGQPLHLKSSLHLGPCLAVNANDCLDYFGTTVNLAGRLVDCCRGGDLACSDDFFRSPETRAFLDENSYRSEPAEMTFRGFARPTKLWRVSFYNLPPAI
jgi:class 3 adenylate cyclase